MLCILLLNVQVSGTGDATALSMNQYVILRMGEKFIFISVFCTQGFAFINFHRREDAARAIAGVSGFGYDHLILNVEWAK